MKFAANEIISALVSETLLFAHVVVHNMPKRHVRRCLNRYPIRVKPYFSLWINRLTEWLQNYSFLPPTSFILLCHWKAPWRANSLEWPGHLYELRVTWREQSDPANALSTHNLIAPIHHSAIIISLVVVPPHLLLLAGCVASRIKENYVDIPPSLSCIPTAKVLWWLGRLNGKLVDDTGAHKKYTLGVIVFIRQYPPPPPFVYISILEISCRQCRVTNVISQRPTTSLQWASVESPLHPCPLITGFLRNGAPFQCANWKRVKWLKFPHCRNSLLPPVECQPAMTSTTTPVAPLNQPAIQPFFVYRQYW